MRSGPIRTAALLALLAVLTASGLVPTCVALVSDGWGAVATLAVQLMLTFAGVLLWLDPENRGHAARLLVAGFLVGVGMLESSTFEQMSGYWLQVGWSSQLLVIPVLLPLLIAYPQPHAEGTAARLLVVGAWLWAAPLRVAAALSWSPETSGLEIPARWLAVGAGELTREIQLLSFGVLVVLATGLCVLEGRRWRSARGAARTTTRLVATSGILLAVGVVLREGARHVIRAGWVDAGADLQARLDLAVDLIAFAAVLALVTVALRSAARRGIVVERLLAAAGDPSAVEDVLRDELSDPTLVLAFRVEDAWVSARGGPPPGGGAGAGRVKRVLLDTDARPVALLDADEQVGLDPAQLRVTLAAATLVLQNTRLAAERSAHLAELAASRARIVQAGVEQRRRLERDLHDGAQQSLLAVATTLSRASLTDGEGSLRTVVDDARAQLTAALAELRSLARGIHPAALSQGGLPGGLAGLAPGVEDVEVRLGPEIAAGTPLVPAAESTAYFVAAEALANALRHAAGSAVTIEADLQDAALVVTVLDHGPGGAVARPGGGLAGLADRVRALGGTLEVDSPTGAGTRVRARLPEALAAATP